MSAFLESLGAELHAAGARTTLGTSPEPGSTRSDGGTPLGPHAVLRYAVVEGAERYRRLMRVLHAEHRHFGLRMTPGTVGERLRDAFALDLEPATLEAGLDQLHAWGAVDREYDTSLARSAAELRRNRFTYDITQAGRRVETLLEDLDGLAETVGALEGSRLPAIRDALARIAALLEGPDADARALRGEFERLLGDVGRLHAGASDFMSRLNRVIATSEQIDEEEFEACKGVLIEHLQGFRTQLRRHAGEIEAALARVGALGPERLAALIVSVEEIPALPGFSPEHLAAQRHAELLEQWRGLRAWFAGSERSASPWTTLAAKVVDAIRAVLDIAERLIDRRTARADRARACEHLARLAYDASEGGASALVVAALGIGHPRHVSVPELDPDAVAAPGRTSWTVAPAAPVMAHLRRPGARTPGAGRGAPIQRGEEVRRRLAERRARERAELDAMLSRFAARQDLRLSDLTRLSPTEFAHVLEWIGRAFETPADATGARSADSRDGRARIRLRPPTPASARTVLVVPQGRFETPDFRLEVVVAR